MPPKFNPKAPYHKLPFDPKGPYERLKKLRIKASDGGLHDLPAHNLYLARKRDPQLRVLHPLSGQTVGETLISSDRPATHIHRNGRIERLK
jgi:hypothetical protein